MDKVTFWPNNLISLIVLIWFMNVSEIFKKANKNWLYWHLVVLIQQIVPLLMTRQEDKKETQMQSKHIELHQ